MSARTLLAHVDESLSNAQHDPGTYILAAGIVETADLEEVRGVVAGLRLPAQHKLHWRDESRKRQQLVVETIDQLPMMHMLVIRSDDSASKPERRRRQCMERLLYELDQQKTATVTFESRGPADDKRDRQMVDVLRAKKTISSEMRLEHQTGRQEPMLWVPDALCGAATLHRTGDPSYFKQIRGVEVIDV